jgi:hypothetical protein
MIPNNDSNQWMRVGHHGHHLHDSDKSKNDALLKVAENMLQNIALHDSEIVSTTAPVSYQRPHLTSSLNPSRSSPPLDAFSSAGKGHTQRFIGLDFDFGQQHGTESSFLTEVDRELESRMLKSQSIRSDPKVLQHTVTFPDVAEREPRAQPDAGQTAKETLQTRETSKARDANIQTQAKGAILGANSKEVRGERSMKSRFKRNTPKPKVTFATPEITLYMDRGYDDYEDMEPDEQPASTKHEAGDAKMKPSDNNEILDSIRGSENRSRALPFGDEFPGRASSSPSIEGDEDIDSEILGSVSGSPSIEDDEDIDFEFVYALHTFPATVEGQIGATKGDTMVLLDDSNSYWWLVRLVKDGSIGYLPAEFVETPIERLGRLNKHRNTDLSATIYGEI